MQFSPIPNTKIVDEADRYIGVIPPLGIGGSGKFSIYAKDSQGQFQLYPRKNQINIAAIPQVASDVVLNEFLADNVNSFPDPSGEQDDWLELYNPTANAVLLTGRYLTDNPTNLTKWKFTQPSLYLNPGQFIVVWCDEDLTQPGLHTNFKLSKSGEFIALVDTNGVSILDSIFFGPQKTDTSFGRYPNGSNSWYFMNPTPGGTNTVTSIENDFSHANDFILAQNYPNPFNPATNIRYSIPCVGARCIVPVQLKVFDILGNEVATLVDEHKLSGRYEVEFDSASGFGNLASGIYFYRLQAGSFVETKKMILIR
jgi:hypothetical protein